MLFEVLVQETVQKNRLPLLVLFNKTDALPANASADTIVDTLKASLEHELYGLCFRTCVPFHGS